MNDDITLYCGDCLEVMRGMADKSVDAVITDPPYPDYYADEYKYREGMIDFLTDFDCRQLIFWSAKTEFPLDYTAIHIWDKVLGVGSMYERIFERNGQKNWRVHRAHPINCEWDAMRGNDVYTGHKSQKPIYLMRMIINKYTKEGDTILDPFMGSGTTGVACVQTGRNFIGIEINPTYFAIAEKRIAEAQLQLRLPLEAECERFTVHSDIERQDDKSPNDTQTQTIVYGKESEG